ncbi:MAG: metal-dependent hydrolase [Deltaproteobacteria bacterium]|nr:metal-dependent hydrolase [Deltaproteobacteria bacterium]
MDPVTQGLLGAAASQALLGDRLGWRAGLIGGLAGSAADVDILFRSSSDPLLGLEMHRHFTHSLAFAPAGGLLVGLLGWLILRRRAPLRLALLAGVVAYFTHGLLDVMTSYGTLWLWPFSDLRLAWDWLPIVDLFVTGPLLAGLLLSRSSRVPRLPAAIALLAFALYCGLGALQHHRACEAQQRLAAQRGHAVERGRAMPTPLQLLAWRSVYVSGEDLYADAFYVPLIGSIRVYEGGSAPRIDPRLSGLPAGSTAARDLVRFDRFADGYLAVQQSGVIGDLRYSLLPHGLTPIWGIRLDPAHPDRHAERIHFRGRSIQHLCRYPDFLLGRGGRPLDGPE